MSQDQPAGPVVRSFFADHLISVKGMLVRTAPGRVSGSITGSGLDGLAGWNHR
jgi:hypothetical protein